MGLRGSIMKGHDYQQRGIARLRYTGLQGKGEVPNVLIETYQQSYVKVVIPKFRFYTLIDIVYLREIEK